MNEYLLKILKDKALETGVDLRTILIDEFQAFFLEEFYKTPASNGAVLFGGGRFRHINNSIRFSIDLDFFTTKNFNYDNITDFISKKFIRLLKNKYNVSARVIDIPPWQKSNSIETIRLFLHNDDFNQIEIDFDFIMREPAYQPENSLLGNIVVSAANSKELLEEKLISIYERSELKIRDIFDLWYYRNLAVELNKSGIHKKILERGISKESINKRLEDFSKHRNYYIKEITNIIKSCGEKRPEVTNLLRLDMNVILDYIINLSNKYLIL